MNRDSMVSWQVYCSRHAPQQTVQFAPPAPLATRTDGVLLRITKSSVSTTDRALNPPQPPSGGVWHKALVVGHQVGWGGAPKSSILPSLQCAHALSSHVGAT